MNERDLIEQCRSDLSRPLTLPDLATIARHAEDFTPDRGYARPLGPGNEYIVVDGRTIAVSPGKAEYLIARHPTRVSRPE